MSSDLIFHIVSRRKWHNLNKGGFFKPEEFDEETGIKCVQASFLNDYLNTGYKGRKNLLLLVIDKSRLINKYSTGKSEEFIYILGGINIDAILDKIRLDCTPEGTFDIEISTK
ncbi:MAG: DUF952 domain-containing protein [Balneolaceae bacterium]